MSTVRVVVANNYKTDGYLNGYEYDYRHPQPPPLSQNNAYPQTYNASWHVREAPAYGGDHTHNTDTTKVDADSCCKCLPRNETQEPTMRYNTPQSAANVVASYGVYHDAGLRSEDDEDGFIPRSNAYRGVVVNATGGTSVVRPNEPPPAESESCGWCVNPQPASSSESCWMSWCKPTILLLILVLLVIVFVLVSGVLLYFNCTLLTNLIACNVCMM